MKSFEIFLYFKSILDLFQIIAASCLEKWFRTYTEFISSIRSVSRPYGSALDHICLIEVYDDVKYTDG